MVESAVHRTAYDEFLKRSTVQKTAKEWIDKELRSCLNGSVAIIRTDNIDALSVGAGEGELDLKILNVLVKCISRWGSIRYTVLEPDGEALEKFKVNIASLQEDIRSKVEFIWLQTSFEAYVALNQNQKDQEKFHFIHFLHSLQYMDSKQVLKECYETFLVEDGALLSMVESEKSCSQKIYRKFSVHTENLLVNPGLKPQELTSIESLKTFASKSNWAYKCFSRSFTFDLTECFREGSASGDLLLDFLLRVKDLRRTASSQLMEEIMQFLAEECKKGGLGGSMAVGGLGTIVIYKK